MVAIASQVIWLAPPLHINGQKKYPVVTVGEESQDLVLCPEENQRKMKRGRGIRVIDVTSMRLEDLQQPTYAARSYSPTSGKSIK
jgi:hypothetical protein